MQTSERNVITNTYDQPTELSTKNFWYDLPQELIAQTPAQQRDMSRLLVLHRENGEMEHKIFHDIIDYLRPGDALVINDSKVIPARLLGVKHAVPQDVPVEFVMLRQMELDTWEVMVHPGRRLKKGAVVHFGNDTVTADILDTVPAGNRIAKFTYDTKRYANIYDMLSAVGNMPLPPYIHEKLADRNRYQTVYAKEEGSAAAPTAGLHFTEELLERIRAKGVDIIPVMLHVGLGTFRPVKEEKIKDHVMHSEFITVTQDSADRINACHKRGGRVIAVGTTSCRTLESVTDENGVTHPMACDTAIFIYPGYHFKCIDALITNFHLPQSTLLMLVSALAGQDYIMAAYREAVAQKYRFFSFGDAMLIE